MSQTRWKCSKALRTWGVMLIASAALLGMQRANAATTTCLGSGSFDTVPSTGTGCGATLKMGDELIITYIFNNTSKRVDTLAGVAAKLVNQTTATEACADNACISQLPDTLAFTPSGSAVDGCEPGTPAGVSCSVSTANKVAITLPAAGLPVTAGGSIIVAKVRYVAMTKVGELCDDVLPGVSGVFATRADSGPNDVVTTDAVCSPQASGGAQGSSNVFFPSYCGDGQIDLELGETCDDGNDVAGDGCTSCQPDCVTPTEDCPATGACADPICTPTTGGGAVCDISYKPATTACVGTSNGGPCDGTDSCDGAGNCVDGYLAATTICRASAGQCDVAESCDGISGACPADGKQPATTACVGTSNGGPCDGTDSCDGAGNCVDGYQAATTICREAAGPCDVAESCTGNSGACPANQYQPAGTQCGDGDACADDCCDANGNCVALSCNQVNCDDGDPCTTDSCDPQAGCQHTGSCEGCITRTPGFWCAHPAVTELYLPVTSCGLTLNSILANLQGSIEEDLNFNNGDAKSAKTSSQQLQLIRQCAAASLNQAASASAGGTCESRVLSNGKTFAEVYAECCECLCTSESTGQCISNSKCIELIDEFNQDTNTIGCSDEDGNGLGALDEGLGKDVWCPSLGANGYNGSNNLCGTVSGNGFVNDRNGTTPGKGLGPEINSKGGNCANASCLGD